MSVTTHMSLQEFLELEDAPGKRELLDGELIELPPAKTTHMDIVKRFLHLLQTVVPEPRVWFETGYQMTKGWLQPDLSVTWPEQLLENDWFQHAPMLAIEIVSPSNRPEHLDKKVAIYFEEGAAEVWIVYPATKSMTVFRKESWVRVVDTYHCEMLGLTVDLPSLLA